MNADIAGMLPFLIFLWSVSWGGLALWRASKLDQKNWFIALLVFYLYTFGTLAIVYLFYFAKKKLTRKELFSFFKR